MTIRLVNTEMFGNYAIKENMNFNGDMLMDFSTFTTKMHINPSARNAKTKK